MSNKSFRSIKGKEAATALLLSVFLFLGGQPAPADAPATQPAATQPAAIRIFQFFGDGQSIGQAEGHALSPEIILLNRDYLHGFIWPQLLYDALSREAQGFIPFLQPEESAEIKAMAAASGLNESDSLLGQCFLDLLPAMGCSTVTLPASAAPDHVARFGRNLDFPSRGIADKHAILVVYHPQGCYAFAAVTWPGLVGVLSGMNEHGLTLASMEVTRLPRGPSAEPYILLYRQVLERCRTVDEAIDYLRKTPKQSSNNLMLMDAAGNRAVVEIAPDSIIVRRAPDTAALISTNHQRGTDLDKPGMCWRFDSLHDVARENFGQIGATQLQRMLHDVMQGSLTIESMVFEPSDRVLYLAVGRRAANYPFQRIDLAPYFAARN